MRPEPPPGPGFGAGPRPDATGPMTKACGPARPPTRPPARLPAEPPGPPSAGTLWQAPQHPQAQEPGAAAVPARFVLAAEGHHQGRVAAPRAHAEQLHAAHPLDRPGPGPDPAPSARRRTRPGPRAPACRPGPRPPRPGPPAGTHGPDQEPMPSRPACCTGNWPTGPGHQSPARRPTRGLGPGSARNCSRLPPRTTHRPPPAPRRRPRPLRHRRSRHRPRPRGAALTTPGRGAETGPDGLAGCPGPCPPPTCRPTTTPSGARRCAMTRPCSSGSAWRRSSPACPG